MSANLRKLREGVVVRRSGDKSIVVEVQRFVIHPRVRKYMRRRSRFHVHDPNNRGEVGDVVVIQESRPLSRMKRWVLQSVVKKEAVVELPPELAAN